MKISQSLRGPAEAEHAVCFQSTPGLWPWPHHGGFSAPRSPGRRLLWRGTNGHGPRPPRWWRTRIPTG
jgi:hypothetical protein